MFTSKSSYERMAEDPEMDLKMETFKIGEQVEGNTIVTFDDEPYNNRPKDEQVCINK